MSLPLSPHPFRPRLVDALRDYSRPRFFADLGAGITVGIVALPLAMAFAIASGDANLLPDLPHALESAQRQRAAAAT